MSKRLSRKDITTKVRAKHGDFQQIPSCHLTGHYRPAIGCVEGRWDIALGIDKFNLDD